jgi:hypothetical protein
MTEEVVAMPGECEPLEETSDVEHPVAAPLEPLHTVVEALHTPTGLSTHEVMRDLFSPPLDGSQKALELGQPALTHPLAPRPIARSSVDSNDLIISKYLICRIISGNLVSRHSLTVHFPADAPGTPSRYL